MKKFLALILSLTFSASLWGQGISYPPPTASALAFGSTLINVTTARIHTENAGSGDNDLYTVPAGMRALVAIQYYNTAGTTTTFFQEAKISSVYYRLSTNATILTVANNSTSYIGFVFEAGESISINTSQAGLNIFGTVYLFPNTAPLKTARLTSLSSGENTIYTCPAGKTAYTPIGNPGLSGNATWGVGAVSNSTAGGLNYYLSVVSSGGSPGSANRATSLQTAVATVGVAFFTADSFSLAAGDFVSVNSSGSGATQFAYITVVEQ